jgi:hypothetical protein
MIRGFAFFVGLVLALGGCDRAKTNQAQTRPYKPASFRDTIFASVTPTADGGAYAIGDSGLWYLRGSQAVKVRFSNLPTDKDATFFATLQITPWTTVRPVISPARGRAASRCLLRPGGWTAVPSSASRGA